MAEGVIKRYRSGTPYITFPKKIFDEFFSEQEETPVKIVFERGRIVIERKNSSYIDADSDAEVFEEV